MKIHLLRRLILDKLIFKGWEKGTEPSAKSSQLALQANALPHVMPMIPVDFDDGKSSKANGVSAMKLLENNARAFNQIAANFSSLQIEDNISLFCQARDNLQVLLNRHVTNCV
ncbi:hypothetical protein CK203_033007 [Vitis vinifera]|uniref:Uncharacterized protein n=1 Tax=Vitis vinifera TaxID=29760 RepID=A0A438HVV0_VITVI|nr:hypothetical protein CK203_033007 [Vitis vinifera]